MREKASKIYFNYKLIDSNQDWKYKGFYMNNHLPSQLNSSMYVPKHDDCWKDEPKMEECLHIP
jgi:hypothetical protein